MSQQRAAIYALVEPSQSADTFGLDRQVYEAQQYCREYGYIVNEQHIYQEVLTKTASGKRPQVTLLLEAAKRGEFEIVVVFALDRLGRNHEQIALLLVTLESYGVHVKSKTEPNGDSGVDAALTQMAQLRTALLEQAETIKRGRIASRIRAGRRSAKEEKGQ